MSFKKTDIEVVLERIWTRKAAEWNKAGDDEAKEEWLTAMEPRFREQAKHVLKTMSKKTVPGWVKEITGDEPDGEPEEEEDEEEEEEQPGTPLAEAPQSGTPEAEAPQPGTPEAKAPNIEDDDDGGMATLEMLMADVFEETKTGAMQAEPKQSNEVSKFVWYGWGVCFLGLPMSLIELTCLTCFT